ncbi:MAG: secondary thiamine-phosphate synthase enzyme YjbQ [bacterium]|nr:secondary thiamine-phosphate synthase enzyme YjbQ [bacterium]
MKTKIQKIQLTSKKQFEVIDITSKIEETVRSSGIVNGIAVIFSPHTTASVKINHNEPLLLQDIMKLLYRTAPVDINYAHDLFEIRTKVEEQERSNGHAHVKAFLLGSSETIPIEDSALSLGDKQSIFFVELDGGRERNVVVRVLGE